MYKVNISIDDISPHPKSSVNVLNQCWDLISEFPNIKFTLFIPMAYKLVKEQEYRVDKYKPFCDIISSLPSSNFEFGWHGYNHDIWNEKYRCKDREFRQLSYEESKDVFDKMFRVAKDAGIIDLFIPVFRPPAFKLSKEARNYCHNNKIKVADFVNVNPPFKSLKLFDKTEILYHACEWDRSYFSKERNAKLKEFLGKNLDDIQFVFIGEL